MTIVTAVVAGGLLLIRVPSVAEKDIIRVMTMRLFRSKPWYSPAVRSSRLRSTLALLVLSISIVAPALSAFELAKGPCCAPAASACKCPAENPCQAEMNARAILPEIALSIEANEKRSMDRPGLLGASLVKSDCSHVPHFRRSDSCGRERSVRHRLRRLGSLRI